MGVDLEDSWAKGTRRNQRTRSEGRVDMHQDKPDSIKRANT